ncbi:hypothetical protein niasHT_011473 [Heterodera trifolii]|uniref:Uncharacterized protein n=1 Tax=Heterodera trifolii TaxID=157864 RepID=A0ABD2L137_9BILA
MVFTRKKTEKFTKIGSSSAEAKRKRKEWRQELAQRGGSTPKRLKQTEAVPRADGEGTSTQAAKSGPSTSTPDLRPRSSPRPLSATPIRRHVGVRPKTIENATQMESTTADKTTHMDLTMLDKATDVDLACEDAATQTEQLDKQLKEQEQAISFLRQQVRNRDAMITDLRRQLEQQAPNDPPTSKFCRIVELFIIEIIFSIHTAQKNAATLERTSRRNLAEKIVDVIDRDRSLSVSRCSLQTLHREVRHKFGHYTPMKKEQLREQQTIHEEDGLLLLFLGGDLSFLWAIIGHCGSAVTTFPSPICDCRRDQMLDAEKCKIRTTEETLKQAEQFGQLVQNGEKPTAAARALTMGIVDEPLLQSMEFDRIILAPFHVFQGIGNALIKELEGSTESAEIANGFFRSISARREAFRKKDMTGNSIRKVLIHADQLERLYSAEWPQIICKTMGHLAKIQTFTKAQPLSPRDLDELETSIDQFRTFLNDQSRMRTLLVLKPKVHLLLNHFVPFARQHQFLALLDEQGDEALHSVWRRLEQLWKTMPDEEQMRQLLEHHFVANWLLDTGKLDEMKRDREEQREEIGDRRETDEESDGEEEQLDFE